MEDTEKSAAMHIAIPRELVSAPVEVCGKDWQDSIWHSRHPEITGGDGYELPEHLQGTSPPIFLPVP